MFPCLPDILSPTVILRFSATKTLIDLFTPAFNSSPFSLESSRISTTTPLEPWGIVSDVSLTSLAFSPNIALKSFSSAGGSVSPLGAVLPTNISPGPTSEPIIITPFSSRFLKALSDTLGISLVISSSPNFVVLASISYSSICIDVNTSSFLSLSDIKIASS